MSAGRGHDVAACARAWQTLRLAHDRVAQRLGHDLARGCDLTINDFDVLLYLRLHAGEAVRMGALVEAVPLSQPALSRLVARLEARGLLSRTKAAQPGEDRRAVVLALTPAGTALIDRAIEIHAAAVDAALTSKFTAEEQATLLRALSQIGR